jgi:hypothetical protein
LRDQRVAVRGSDAFLVGDNGLRDLAGAGEDRPTVPGVDEQANETYTSAFHDHAVKCRV